MLYINANQFDRSAIFRQLINRCPLCHNILNNHSIALLASIILLPEENQKLNDLEQLILSRKWEQVTHFRNGSQDADILQYHLLRCPQQGMALLKLIFTYELWSDDWLDSWLSIQHEDRPQLEKLVNKNWLFLSK